MSRANASRPVPWYIPIFLKLEAKVLELGFAPQDAYSAVPEPKKLDVDPNAMNPMEGKNIRDWPARFYLMSQPNSQFIKVALAGQYTNLRGFQYSVHVLYGDDRLMPLLAKLQGVPERKNHVEIDRCALWQIVSRANGNYMPDRNLKKGQPYEDLLERISKNLESYGIPWARRGLVPESIAETIVNRFSQPAMTIAFALQTGDFNLAVRRLDLVVENRNQRIDSWQRHNKYDSRQALEAAVDMRHLSELGLPNPRFIDGEFIRLAQMAIDERSIEGLMCPD